MAAVSMSPTETSAVIDQVKQHGFDPGLTRACMPSSDLRKLGGVDGIVGCNMWDRCPFGLTKFGGFKGQSWRPKDVIYYLEPNDGSTHAKEDMWTCYEYVQYLANRANDGRNDSDKGLNGEIIQVIGLEECEHPNYVKGDAESVCTSCGFRHQYTESVMVNIGTPLMANWANKSSVKTCPTFVHKSTIVGLQHERDIRKSARDRIAADPDAATGPLRVKGNPKSDWGDSVGDPEAAKVTE